ncbi:hypothetical protein BGZ75_005682 [Mortierella antarctica]|nr:hypothetical protein BGZ75_005682 [Mortierella antarctica]
MPSVVNTNLSSPLHPPSELDFVSDDALSYTRPSSFHPQDSAQKDHTVQKLKELRRRQWSDPDDEFSVPIHTESPLITKKPLGTSSFLLHYRAMHRSVEIMTPPVSQIGRMHDLVEHMSTEATTIGITGWAGISGHSSFQPRQLTGALAMVV